MTQLTTYRNPYFGIKQCWDSHKAMFFFYMETAELFQINYMYNVLLFCAVCIVHTLLSVLIDGLA